MEHLMDSRRLDRVLALLALAACLVVAAMVAGVVMTHSSQEFFQSARAVEQMAARLADNPSAALGVRINLGLDNAFIVLYVSFFALLTVRVRGIIDPWVAGLACGALLLTGVLDAAENQHILTLLHSLQAQLPVSVQETQLQMILSGVKFESSYVGAFLFAFGYSRLGGVGKAIAWIVWAGYIPFGLLISVWPVESVAPLALARTACFIGLFLLSAILFGRKAVTAA
jgi:hypothetical protein